MEWTNTWELGTCSPMEVRTCRWARKSILVIVALMIYILVYFWPTFYKIKCIIFVCLALYYFKNSLVIYNGFLFFEQWIFFINQWVLIWLGLDIRWFWIWLKMRDMRAFYPNKLFFELLSVQWSRLLMYKWFLNIFFCHGIFDPNYHMV